MRRIFLYAIFCVAAATFALAQNASQVVNSTSISNVTGLGTGIATALGINTGTAGAPVINGGALGTPTSGTATNLSGTATGLTAGNTQQVNGSTPGGSCSANQFVNSVSSAAVPSCAQPTTANLTSSTTTFTPTITCGAGAVGSYSRQNGNYIVIGKSITISVDVQAAIGTCSGALTVNLPVNGAAWRQMLPGLDLTTSLPMTCTIGVSASACTISSSTGGNPTGSDNLILTGKYISA